MTNVLVVDSERSIRNTLKERLEYEGYRVETAETGGEAADKTEHSRFDVVLCDMAVPDIRAIDLLTSLHGSGKSTPFIMLSALKGLDPAIDSIRHGAFDYIPKPIDLNKLLRSIRSAVEDKSQNRATIETPSGKKSSAARAGDSARVVAKASCAPTEIVGTSVGIEHMKQLIEKVAPSDARVLITGDNGTGKELVAHRLHELSHRADRPFVEVNCAAIPSELIESELFGHEKGSFTSAIRMRKGKFEQADGGTLFLDEIGDMSLAAQAKVLRALQENRISRVGSDKDITTLFRRAKGVVEAMPRYTHMEAYTLRQVEKPVWADTVVWLNLYLGEEHIGDLALLSKKVSMECGIKNLAVMLLELDMDALIPFRSRTNTFTHLPEYPMTDYDVSVLVDGETRWDAMRDAILEKRHELLHGVSFVDEYRGKQVPEGKKSVTLRLTIGSAEKTLTSQEIEACAASAVKRLAKHVGAELRGK